MYKEMNRIEVICGPVMSGKSLELIKLIKLCQLAGKETAVFSPILNTRENCVKTRFGQVVESNFISNLNEIMLLINYKKIEQISLFIEEFHLFKDNVDDVLEIIKRWRESIKDINIYISGCDMDFMGEPFEIMSKVMGIATKVKKLKAICNDCGVWYASMSYCKQEGAGRITIDNGENYIPLCYECYLKR